MKFGQMQKAEMRKKFQQSSKLEVCNNLIKQFEYSNPKKKYKSDLEVFVRESKLEDFYNENGETIFVSTIHKAKGKEFDNVFIMLENFNPATDEAKRQLYVAMTRAKRNLTIHLNGNYLDNLTTENLERVEDREDICHQVSWQCTYLSKMFGWIILLPVSILFRN